MPKQIPALQDRRDFPAWQKAIQNKLTPRQWATVTWSDGGPPDNGPGCLLWEKVRAQAYNTIIQSIPNFIIAGLGAHDELNSLREFYYADDEHYKVCGTTGGCPRELYEVICKYFDPTRAMIAAQIRCIANTDPATFKDVDEYLARMWLSKLIPIRRWLRSWRRWTTRGRSLRCCVRWRRKVTYSQILNRAPPRGSGWQTIRRERQRGSRRKLRRKHLLSRWLRGLLMHRDRNGSGT
ncbi:hypothetical protein CKAH01_07338 [Colletotrichum kahawae]|uniref:Uncharacterized protein n=1 Tax=Colletotrichum kahawae TaxID=34407 RepID=A0AAD9Y6F2_COLKA|nr:hypothetical protein CKAH01_07338 [Colletotrichum kahawae]